MVEKKHQLSMGLLEKATEKSAINFTLQNQNNLLIELTQETPSTNAFQYKQTIKDRRVCFIVYHSCAQLA